MITKVFGEVLDNSVMVEAIRERQVDHGENVGGGEGSVKHGVNS